MDYSKGLFFKNEEMMKEVINILKDRGFDFEKCSSYKAICFEEADCYVPIDTDDYEEFLYDLVDDENITLNVKRSDFVKSFAEALYHSGETIIDEDFRNAILDEVIEGYKEDVAYERL